MLLLFTLIALALFIYLGLKKPAVAFVTSPIIAGILLVMGIEVESVAVVIISPLLYVLTLILIVTERRDELADRWPRRWSLVILSGVFIIALLFAGGIFFGPFGFYGLMFLFLLVVSIISFGLTSRSAVAAYVISTIGSAMRQNLPLPMALDSAASGRKDERARTLRRIAKWLVQGYSLSEAIKRGYPKCPGYAVSIIAASEKINQLPSVFESLEADMMAKADQSRQLRPIHPLYPLILIAIIVLILMGMMTFVIPKFTEVLREMGAPLPTITTRVMQITNFFVHSYGWLFFTSFLIIFLIGIPVSIRIKFRPRRPDKPYRLSRIGDFLKWHLPVLHWFEYNYSMVHAIELLRVSLNAGCTVDEAIANTLGLDVNNRFRNRLVEWLDRVKRGEDIAVAAHQSGLGTSLVWAFEREANTPAILETLENFFRFNYSYRVNLARFIFWPCVNITIGILVGFIVYSFFVPIIAILNHLVSLVVS
jgi:type II secretory pathway component PulF